MSALVRMFDDLALRSPRIDEFGSTWPLFGFDRFFDGFFRDDLSFNDEIRRTDTGFEIDIIAPGLKREDFHVTIQTDELRVCVGHSDSTSSRSFKKMWKLPKDARLTDVSAKYESGILSLNIPLDEKHDDTVTIDVK